MSSTYQQAGAEHRADVTDGEKHGCRFTLGMPSDASGHEAETRGHQSVINNFQVYSP